MLLSKSSVVRLIIKKGLLLLGENFVSFSNRISYSPLKLVDREGNWSIYQHNGIEWKLDISLGVDSTLYRTGVFEPESTRWVHELVKPGMVVADVGANFGYYTIQCSKLVDSAGRVYAFEPSFKFRERLLNHIQRNHCRNVHVVKEGLSNKKETHRLYVGGDSASLYYWDTNINEAVWEKVNLITFDSFAAKEKLSRLDFLKVDIDGNEMRFLAGAKKTLKKMKPTILIECNQLALQKAGSDVNELARYLRGLGYELRSEKTGAAFANNDELYREAKNCAFSVNILCVPENVNLQAESVS